MPQNETKVRVKILQPPSDDFKLTLPDNAPLLAVMQGGAEAAGVGLLPDVEEPFDLLHNIARHDEVGPPIDDLNQELGDYLRARDTTRDFGIELSLSIRVNTRWDVATTTAMTPREILALPRIALDFQQYTLYFPNNIDVLPLDTPIQLHRGLALEAQRDGKYGQG